MTVRVGSPSATVARIAATLAQRDHAADSAPSTWMLGAEDEPEAIERDAGRGVDRILVLSWIGAHPDARADVLRRLWALEERCRATSLPTLVLRLAPLVGPDSPLWRKLAETRPAARLARKLMHPVLESDVIEAVDRALRGTIAWDGWQELGGMDVLSFDELASLARASRPARGGAWEPDPDALAEQRLIEPGVWAGWSGIEPGSVAAEAARWAA